MSLHTNAPQDFGALSLEDAIECFERDWYPGKCDQIQSILERYSLTDDLEALTELVRTDIELLYANGQELELQDYLAKFEAIRSETRSLSDVAYEDFRSRVSFGFSVSPERWQGLPGIEQEDWFEVLKGIHSNVGDGSHPIVVSADQASDLDQPLGGDGPSFDPALTSSFGVPIRGSKDGAENDFVDGSLALALSDAGFRIVQRIGRGAFGDVFLATQDDLANRFVVLKIVRQSLSEPLQLARLQHAHIVPIYSCHEMSGYSVLCMPYWGRLTLAAYLDCVQPSLRSGESLVATVLHELSDTVGGPEYKGDAFEPRRPVDVQVPLAPTGQQTVLGELATLGRSDLALSLYGKLASALAHSHTRGILHCDIKPQNVLIRHDGEPALFDFNLAHSTTMSGVEPIGGTPPYLSPEACQALMGKGNVPAVSWDVYSLGVMMFQFVTGRLPYAAPPSKASVDLEAAVASRRHPLQWSGDDALSVGMKAILTKSLAFEVEDRYRSADELCVDLDHESNGRALVHANEPAVSKIKKWSARHPRLLTSVGVAFLLFGVLLPVANSAVQARLHSAQLESESAFDSFSRRSDESLAKLVVDPGRIGSIQDSDAWQLFQSSELSDPMQLSFLLGQEEIDSEVSKARRDVLYRHLVQLGLLEGARLRRIQSRGGTSNGKVSELDRDVEWAHEMADLDKLMDVVAAIVPDKTLSSWLHLSSQHVAIHGGREEADRLSEVALATEINTPNETYLEAIRQLANSRWRLASDLLASLADKDDIKPALRWTLLGRAQYMSGDYERAKLSFTQSIEHQTESSRLHLMLGLCHYKLQEFKHASAVFSKARQLDPELTFAWQNEALSELSLGRRDSAVEILGHGLDQNPGNVPMLLLRSRVNRRLGNSLLADRDFDQAMRATDLNAQQLVSRAKARRASDVDGAITDLKAAHQLDREDISALHELASVLVAKGEILEAVESLEQVLVVSPENEKAAADQAVLLARLSRHDEAAKKIGFALEEPNASVVLYQAACVHALNESPRLAVTYLARAMRAGFSLQKLAEDPDLQSLHSYRGFQAIQQTLALLRPSSNRKRLMNQPVSSTTSLAFPESLAGLTP